MQHYSSTYRKGFFALCLYFLLTILAAEDLDYDAQRRLVLTPGSRPFRMQKINDIWTKAQKRLAEKKLEKLYKDLQKQDKAEIKWKNLKANGEDKDGEIEAKNRRRLFKILENYGLKEHFPYDDIVDNRSTKQAFGDKKLDKLWEEARSQGKFDQEELQDLKIELSHYKQKVDELKLLRDTFDEDISENSVMHDKTKGKNRDQLKKKLEKHHNDINQLYSNLEVRVRGEKTEKEFEDPRVSDLWEGALNGDFSADQLASIKEELQHFDQKIKKHESIQEQVELAEKLLSEGNTHIKDKHERLQKKYKEGKRYVEKMHLHLQEKVKNKEEL